MEASGIWADMDRLPERGPVDLATFRNEILTAHEPVVLRGQAADWPLVEIAKQGRQALADAISAAATDTRVNVFIGQPEMKGRFGYTPDVSGFNFERRQVSVKRLVENLLTFANQENAPHVYAGAVLLSQHLPSFLTDALVQPIETPNPPLVSLWLGSASTTAAHWDLTQNIAAVINGTRRFTLLPISQLPNLYIGPLDRTLAGQPTSLVDIEAPDFARFPGFADALPHARYADLEPGDAIYIPSLWVHQVMNRDPFGAMVNTWWREGLELPTPLLTLYHAITTLKHMPPAERAQWKPLFEHYIFEENGDPVAHIPEAARGVLGEASPELFAAIRDYLRKADPE